MAKTITKQAREERKQLDSAYIVVTTIMWRFRPIFTWPGEKCGLPSTRSITHAHCR